MPAPFPLPAGPRRSRPWWPAGGAVITAAALIAALVVMYAQISRVDSRIHSLSRQLQTAKASQSGSAAQLGKQIAADQSGLSGLAGRVSNLEATQRAQPNLAAVAKSVKQSVFEISTPTDLGSAWVVTTGAGTSTLVTNFHVVSDTWNSGGRSVQVIQGDATYTGTVAQVDINDDLALISTPETFPALTITAGAPQVGDSVLVVGAPLGLDQTVANGIVSAMRTDSGHSYLQFSAPISPGDSGGPVVNQTGQVVGVTVAKLVAQGAEGLSLAIPAAVLCSGLNKCP